MINIALTWDAYLAWHRQLYTRLPVDADDATIDAHGLSMLHRAIALKAMFEEASDHASKFWYPHLAMTVYPVCVWKFRTDLWDMSMSALELSHAAVGRILDRTAAKRLTSDQEGGTTLTTQPMLKAEGPARLVLWGHLFKKKDDPPSSRCDR